MKTRKYKTNINCGECVRNVIPYINALPSVTSWDIDISDKDKLLIVRGEFKDEEIEKAVKDAGFKVKN